MKFFISMFFCFSFVLAANDSVSSNDMHTKLDDMIVERGFASTPVIGDSYGLPIASSVAPSNAASPSSAIVVTDVSIQVVSGNGAIFKDGPFGTNITATNTASFLSSAGTLTINGSLIVTGILTIQDGVTLNVRGDIYLYGSLNIVENVAGTTINAGNFICDGMRNGTSVINTVQVHTATINAHTLVFKNYYTTGDQAIFFDSRVNPLETYLQITPPVVKTTINAHQIIFDNNQAKYSAVYIYITDLNAVNDIVFTNNTAISAVPTYHPTYGYSNGYAVLLIGIPYSNPDFRGSATRIRANMVNFANNTGITGGVLAYYYVFFWVDIFKIETNCALNDQKYNLNGAGFYNREGVSGGSRITWITNHSNSCTNSGLSS